MEMYCESCKYFNFAEARKMWGHTCDKRGSCDNWACHCEDYEPIEKKEGNE